jgi:3-dehydroquinate dehydratase-2
MKYKIIVINGPNLNLLGEREKEKYGDISLKKIETECLDFAAKNNIELTFKQSNIEGEIVSLIQECRNKYSGLIINAAGYTHTSVSILDALMVLKIPVIELHITNIYNREEFRHKSLISKAATGIICGFGVKGYIMALEATKNILKNENR